MWREGSSPCERELMAAVVADRFLAFDEKLG